ncbi:MAG TPA: hypothetical protein VLL08_25575 [Kineosporiaceae bacterium]|nr:hypothetical protein [Kineosporiaceae bacterium]
MPRVTMAATLLVCLTLTAGCSGSSPGDATSAAALLGATGVEPAASSSPLTGLSALEVWEKTKADADTAKSVHVTAKFLDGKKKIALNLKMTDNAKVFGFLVLNGNRVKVRRLGRTLYFKADYGFWASNADAATGQTLADKWIMVKQGYSADLDQLFRLTDMDSIVADTMSLSVSEQGKLKLAPGIKLGKRSTVGLVDDSTESTQEVQTLYVWASDPALPLKFAMSADDSQFMRFQGWNKTFAAITPPKAIDLAKAS